MNFSNQSFEIQQIKLSNSMKFLFLRQIKSLMKNLSNILSSQVINIDKLQQILFNFAHFKESFFKKLIKNQFLKHLKIRLLLFNKLQKEKEFSEIHLALSKNKTIKKVLLIQLQDQHQEIEYKYQECLQNIQKMVKYIFEHNKAQFQVCFYQNFLIQFQNKQLEIYELDIYYRQQFLK
ncbi:unnamed protein product [Paramecium sonneborni]|uniref:Uncharacterized protein n=1 Tax=Paramecium sonneborni TaxID=65129 RepID=A0A8S1RCB0_9CILI|nr:unnamed protein product [Paramecium sonneborni]